tara:strand:- start:62 stop:691 length:630 start_codon:yes stop_codon:yes gene_type:complete
MKDLVSSDLFQKVSKTSLTLPTYDYTVGVKQGSVINIKPRIGEFEVITKRSIVNGNEHFETSPAKAFTYADVLLVRRYVSKEGESVVSKTPAFAVNVKVSSSANGSFKYVTMMFRYSLAEDICKSINDVREKRATDVEKGKAFYCILEDNGLNIDSWQSDIIENGGTFKFAQYKKKYDMNFISANLYESDTAKYGPSQETTVNSTQSKL